MPREKKVTKQKPKREPPKLSDDDILQSFLMKKNIKSHTIQTNNHLTMTVGKRDELILMWRFNKDDQWHTFATIGFIDGVTGKRTILVISPEYGDRFILMKLFGAFESKNILYSKGYTEIKLTQAVELNENYFLQHYANGE